MNTTLRQPTQLFICRAGNHLFGIDVLEVQEVLKSQNMTPVPSACREVIGLINLRGDIVTAISLRERLGLKPDGEEGEGMNVIVSLQDGPASIVVDSVGEVISVEPNQYKPRPSTLASPLREMVSGVYQLLDSLVLHLDPEIACQISQREG